MISRTVYKKIDGYFEEDLLQSSIDHYLAAKSLMKGSASFFDSAGYLFQLSIELMFKSWVLHIKNEFDGTHSLPFLRQILIESGARLPFSKADNKAIDHISGLYELRYPNRVSPTEIGDAELEMVSKIIEKLWQSLPDTLVDKLDAIPFGKKGGRVLMEKRTDDANNDSV